MPDISNKTLKEKAVNAYIAGRHFKVPGYFPASGCFEKVGREGTPLGLDGLLGLMEELVLCASRSGMHALNMFVDDVELLVGQAGDDFTGNRSTVYNFSGTER